MAWDGLGELEVDALTRQRLGEGLAEVGANLWPHTCQSCGESLLGQRSALYVEVGDGVAAATVHHPACQPARWHEPAPGHRLRLVAPATLNSVVRALLLPVGRDASDAYRPFLLVNPGLEQIVLAHDGTRWRTATVDDYARFGLRRCGSEGLRISTSDPVPDAVASLDDTGNITVVLGDRRAAWTAGCDPHTAAAISEAGGIALAVTTAVFPDQDLEPVFGELATAITAGQIASGWIRLTPDN